MKKTLLVTFVLVACLALLFTQAFASAPGSQGQHPSAYGKPQKTQIAPKTHGPKVKPDKGANASANNSADDAEEIEPTDQTGETEPVDTTGQVDVTQQPPSSDIPVVTQAPVTVNSKGNGHGKPEKAKNVLNGSVSSVDGNTVVITLKDGSTVNVTLDANTSLKVPTLKDTTGYTFTPGQRLVAKVVENEDGTYSVSQAHVIPGKPEKIHRVGTVTEYLPGVSITVTDKFGNTTTFALSADSRILSEDGTAAVTVGSVVTIISPRDVTGGELSAKGIVVHLPETNLPMSPITNLTATATLTETPTLEPTATLEATATETPTEEPTATPEMTATETPAVP